MVHRGESETESESTEDDAFLGTVRQGNTDLWVTKARVNGIFIECSASKISRGDPVTISENSTWTKSKSTTRERPTTV